MYCLNCGKKIDDDSKFCVFCGKKVGASVNSKASNKQFVGFWIRLMAYAVDILLILLIGYAIGLLVILILYGDINFNPGQQFTNWYWILTISFLFLYSWFMASRYQATIGKIIFQLQIISSDGKKVSWGKAFLREIIGKIISAVSTFGLGFLVAGLTDEKTSLHDAISSTRVVYK